jgi:uncharacterized protein (DUF58 family)
LTGRATLGIGLAMVLAGAAFDSPSLYVPGLALAILSLGLRAWVSVGARSTRLERLTGPWSVVEGQDYPASLRIRSAVPLPGGQLVDPLLDRPRPLGMRPPRQLSANARFERRGRRVLEPARLVIADPLGLHEGEVKSSGGVEVLVLPRIEPVLADDGSGSPADEERPDGSERGIGGAGLDTGAIEFEVDGLRPYRVGSPASRIHWPTVARSGELFEHKLVTGGRASPLVVLDASEPASEDWLDEAVRAAASLCFHLARAGGCAVALPGEARLLEIGAGLRAWPKVHARLALVEPGGPAPRLRRWPRGELVFWVTARRDPSLPRGAGAPGTAVGFLVAPEAAGGGPSAFTVGGCRGRRLEPERRPAAAREAAPA